MYSLANLPSESKCKQIIYKIVAGQTTCLTCNSKISWKREYGWCKVCRKKLRPKSALCFRNSNLTYQQMFALVLAFQQRQSPGSIKLATGLSYPTTRRWYQCFRDHIPPPNSRLKLSGIVEVDESYFGKRRYGHQTIVIGAIERDTKHLRLEIIQDTERDTLEGFVLRHIAPGSLVITDAHPGYYELSILGYDHETWNHSKGHFAGTNHIEQNWSAMKRYLKKLYGNIPTKDLPLILNEWQARHNRPEFFETVERFMGLLFVPD